MRAEEYLALVATAERSGDWLGAHDAATRGLATFPDDVKLRHRAVLALARSGATTRAREQLEQLGLAAAAGEDVAALGARIAKDWALAATGAERVSRARVAADRYAEVFARFRGYYPAVNAATMYLLAGDRERAAAMAREALAACERSPEDYWRVASEIEARLVLGDPIGSLVARARSLAGDDHGALGTTLRQLELFTREPALAALRPPSVIHYTGHRAGRLGDHDVEPRIAALLAEHDVGYGFGGLASGADILFAEALLERGAELHVVLPLARDAYVAASVGDWVSRFDACLARAKSVRIVADGEADDVLHRYGAHVAMGLAILRARHLHTSVRQLAVWDGRRAGSEAGTVHVMSRWADSHLPQTVIDVPPASSHGIDTPQGFASRGPAKPDLAIRALVFGDVKGFSKLREAQVPTFVSEIMGALGGVLDAQGGDVLSRNSWGDGIYVVLTTAAAAAKCTLALQDTMRALDLAALGLPPHCALRVAAHLGPVHRCYDAVARTDMFCGTHVTQAARIEPITPEGEVYVTEAFAAALALETADYRTDYVGDVPTAKSYGSLRMHLLRRSA